MTLHLFTFRGRFTGNTYEATGHNKYQAARQLAIAPSRLILLSKKPTTLQLINNPLRPAKKQNSPASPTLPANG